MRKLIIAHNLDEALKQKVTAMLPDWDVLIGRDSSIWEEHLGDAEVIAGWRKEMASTLENDRSNLRWIQSWSAGVDSYPLEKLSDKNIYLTSANGVHAYPISETIYALMLGLTRKIHTYVKNQTIRKWYHEHLSLEMHNKTIGIIGVGAIGKETAKIAKAFGMHVIGVRNSNKNEDYVDEMVTTQDLNAVLPKCDYVVVTVPLTKDTHRLFTSEQFALMKSTAFFINIGRGEVVDEGALVEALQTDKIAGAGLDVFETEPLEDNSPLWELENVILTPHTSGATEYYNERVVEDILIPNLKDYINGKSPSINLVDYNKGY